MYKYVFINIKSYFFNKNKMSSMRIRKANSRYGDNGFVTHMLRQSYDKNYRNKYLWTVGSELQKGKCNLCNQKLRNGNMIVDHIVQKQYFNKYGENINKVENFQVLCSSCNSIKTHEVDTKINVLIKQNDKRTHRYNVLRIYTINLLKKIYREKSESLEKAKETMNNDNDSSSEDETDDEKSTEKVFSKLVNKSNITESSDESSDESEDLSESKPKSEESNKKIDSKNEDMNDIDYDDLDPDKEEDKLDSESNSKENKSDSESNSKEDKSDSESNSKEDKSDSESDSESKENDSKSKPKSKSKVLPVKRVIRTRSMSGSLPKKEEAVRNLSITKNKNIAPKRVNNTPKKVNHSNKRKIDYDSDNESEEDDDEDEEIMIPKKQKKDDNVQEISKKKDRKFISLIFKGCTFNHCSFSF